MTSAFPTVYDRGASMPADTAKQETWLDWWPDDEVMPEELLTRQRFVDRLRGEGVEVTVFDLMNWEKRGITPRPTRQRVGRTTHAMHQPQKAVRRPVQPRFVLNRVLPSPPSCQGTLPRASVRLPVSARRTSAAR